MGAFEDRLAEGYRKAERAPLRTAQTTTPTTETGKRYDVAIADEAGVMRGVPAPAIETVHCAGCTGSDYLGRTCRGRYRVSQQEATAQERRRLLEAHMADHDDATGWCSTCSLLTEGE